MEVLVFIRPQGGDWDSVAMNSIGGAGPGWMGTIPANATNKEWLDYYLQATDDDGLVSYHPGENPQSKPHRVFLTVALISEPPCAFGGCVFGVPIEVAIPILFLALIVVSLVIAILVTRRGRRKGPAVFASDPGRTEPRKD